MKAVRVHKPGGPEGLVYEDVADPKAGAGQAVVKAMLQQFAAMLATLAGHKVTFINGQGTLIPRTSSWHNELHPAKAGFEKFADMFQHEPELLFPARVA